MNWEVFDNSSKVGEATVSIQSSGCMGVSAKANKMLSGHSRLPIWVTLMFDSDKSYVGLQPSNIKSSGAYEIRPFPNSTDVFDPYYIASYSFSLKYDLIKGLAPHSTDSRRFSLKKLENYIFGFCVNEAIG